MSPWSPVGCADRRSCYAQVHLIGVQGHQLLWSNLSSCWAQVRVHQKHGDCLKGKRKTILETKMSLVFFNCCWKFCQDTAKGVWEGNSVWRFKSLLSSVWFWMIFLWVFFLRFFSAMPYSFYKTAKSLFPLQLGFLSVNRDALAAERSWLSTMVHIIMCV